MTKYNHFVSTSNLLQCFGQENMLLEFLFNNFLFSGAKIVLRPMKSNYSMKINILGLNFFDKISSFCEYIKFLAVIWTRRYAFGVFIRDFTLFGGETHWNSFVVLEFFNFSIFQSALMIIWTHCRCYRDVHSFLCHLNFLSF